MPLVKRGVQTIKSTNLRQMCPSVASYQEATSGLRDILHYLETMGSMKTANELEKVIVKTALPDISQALSFLNKEQKEGSAFPHYNTRPFRLLLHCSVALNCVCKVVNQLTAKRFINSGLNNLTLPRSYHQISMARSWSY